MFTKILIANRGEIAIRVIRACKEMGISTVAVYSQADKESLHVALADQAVCIGGPRAEESYLDGKRIVSAAVATGAQAIHPGYGFLAENPDFASLCKQYGVVFIGPPAEVIASMGDKDCARRLMKENGVPVTPGTDILKGGGGRGAGGGRSRGHWLPGADQSQRRGRRQGHPPGKRAGRNGKGLPDRQPRGRKSLWRRPHVPGKIPGPCQAH